MMMINRKESVRMEKKYKEAAKVFKAFCDENRLMILDLLSGGEKCACVLLDELKISQPTLSHHMKILCDSGIVQSRKEGKWTHYSLCEEGCECAIRYVERVSSSQKTTEGCSCISS
jgi:ArsR family transcriptional regulator